MHYYIDVSFFLCASHIILDKFRVKYFTLYKHCLLHSHNLAVFLVISYE